MADAGFQVCVDAGGQVIKKGLGGGKHKLICYHHGKAYHSDVMEAGKEMDMNATNKGIPSKSSNASMNKRAEQTGDHNL